MKTKYHEEMRVKHSSIYKWKKQPLINMRHNDYRKSGKR